MACCRLIGGRFTDLDNRKMVSSGGALSSIPSKRIPRSSNPKLKSRTDQHTFKLYIDGINSSLVWLSMSKKASAC